MVERADYVFNANDSFWMPHATEMLEGDYSILHGAQRHRTFAAHPRERHRAVRRGERDAPAGDDGTFTGEELRDAALANRASSARFLRGDVVERCAARRVVEVPELTGDDGAVALPAEVRRRRRACAVLAGWDGRFDLDSRGAVLWREFLTACAATTAGAARRAVGRAVRSRPTRWRRRRAWPHAGRRHRIRCSLRPGRAVQTLGKAGLAGRRAARRRAVRAAGRRPASGSTAGYGGEGVTNVDRLRRSVGHQRADARSG